MVGAGVMMIRAHEDEVGVMMDVMKHRRNVIAIK